MTNYHWGLLGLAVFTFSIVGTIQKWFLGRALERIIQDDKWASTVEDWSKMIRQDIAGILLLLTVTNGLLAAVVAVLVFR